MLLWGSKIGVKQEKKKGGQKYIKRTNKKQQGKKKRGGGWGCKQIINSWYIYNIWKQRGLKNVFQFVEIGKKNKNECVV